MHDVDLLLEKLPFLEEKRDVIFDRPELFAGRVVGASLCLGRLLWLWERGQWTVECPECGGKALVTWIGGWPSKSYRARCKNCGARVSGGVDDEEDASLEAQMDAALEQGFLEPGMGRAGRPGSPTENGVERCMVDPVPLRQLVDLLVGGPGRVHMRSGGSGLELAYDFATRTLTDEGRVVATLRGQEIYDWNDEVAATWDGVTWRDSVTGDCLAVRPPEDSPPGFLGEIVLVPASRSEPDLLFRWARTAVLRVADNRVDVTMDVPPPHWVLIHTLSVLGCL